MSTGESLLLLVSIVRLWAGLIVVGSSPEMIGVAHADDAAPHLIHAADEVPLRAEVVADLAATSAGPHLLQRDEQFTHAVTVTNNGPSSSGGAKVYISTSGMQFGSAEPSQGSCRLDATGVTCTLDSLASGGVATIAILGTPNGMGTVTSTAYVVGDLPDPNVDNNKASATMVFPGMPGIFRRTEPPP